MYIYYIQNAKTIHMKIFNPLPDKSQCRKQAKCFKGIILRKIETEV